MSYSDFENNIPSATLTKVRDREAALARRDEMFMRWKESERILGILRAIQAHHEPLTDEIMRNWYGTIESRHFAAVSHAARAIDYFHTRFPNPFERYGPALLEEKQSIRLGMSPQWTPVYLNIDFAAAMLGGDFGLGHSVVFYRPEATFYFFDMRVDAYCRTSDQKIELLASNHLVKAAEACAPSVNTRPIFQDFRSQSTLKAITERAKTILEADQTFFDGPHGKVRFIDGYKLKPQDEPTHRLFIREAVARQPGARMTMSEVYVRYLMYCRKLHLPALPKDEFKPAVAVEIEELFNQRSRNDVPDDLGKHQHGWKNLSCLPVPV